MGGRKKREEKMRLCTPTSVMFISSSNGTKVFKFLNR